MDKTEKKYIGVFGKIWYFIVPLIGVLIILCASVSFSREQFISSSKIAEVSLDPNDRSWLEAKPSRIQLAPQKLLSQPQGGGAITFVEVQSLFTEDSIFFRLRWSDQTKNNYLEVGNNFIDACGLQFPLNGTDLPSLLMGEKGKPVNIWRWNAATRESERSPKYHSGFRHPQAMDESVVFLATTEDLIAEGFGTLTRQQKQTVETNSHWESGYWTVVFKRKLAVQDGTEFKRGMVMPVALAVWDGANADRDGAKSFSVWHSLLLESSAPAESGDPVERGHRVFSRYGCATCHGVQGRGGVKNINTKGGEIPRIDKSSEGYTREELKKLIREGKEPTLEDTKGPRPTFRMNSWKTLLEESELDDLVYFLFSLLPKKEGEKW